MLLIVLLNVKFNQKRFVKCFEMFIHTIKLLLPIKQNKKRKQK